jgi:hypothetical protein
LLDAHGASAAPSVAWPDAAASRTSAAGTTTGATMDDNKRIEIAPFTSRLRQTLEVEM